MMVEAGAGEARVAAVAAFLRGEGPAPAGIARYADAPELALIRAVCKGRGARAAEAARALCAVLFESEVESESESEVESEVESEPESEVGSEVESVPRGRWYEALGSAESAVHRVLATEDEVARLSPWLGVGWHRDGSALVDAVHEGLGALAELLERRPDLVRIADALGSLEATERAGRGVERGGRSGVVGVQTSGDIAQALASDLALLGDPETEDLFLARWFEYQLLELQHSGELHGPPVAERRAGPIIACVDTSGSMIGAPEELAKAATLAVVRRALRAGRRALVVLFGGKGSLETIALDPGRADAAKLFRFLFASFHGGTDFDGAILHALGLRARAPGFQRADILLVTDAIGRVNPATRERLGAERQRGLRVAILEVTRRTGATFAGPAFGPGSGHGFDLRGLGDAILALELDREFD